MSITDELREFANRVETLNTTAAVTLRLRAIADRIDAEHEKAEQDLIDANNQMEQLCECSIRLPVDADGEVIHIGDRVENNERVVRIVLTDGSWEPSVYVEKLPNVLHEYFCNEISHYHAPTVEDVLREFAEGLGVPVADSYIAASAAKLRLAGDAETCRQEERGWATEGDHARVFLTCGHDCMVETVADLPNFCPVCGARVEAAK